MLTPAKMQLSKIQSKFLSNHLNLARQIPLWLMISSISTPVPLVRRRAILSNAVRLVGLVKDLEVEDVDAPGQHATDAALPVFDSVLGAGDGGAVVGAASGGPTSLAVPELGRLGRAGDGLDVAEGLHDVVEVGGGCVFDGLGLPVGEGVDEAVEGGCEKGCGRLAEDGDCNLQQFDASADDGVSGAISVLVPAVGSTNQSVGKHLLNLIDLLEQLLAGEVAAVQRFRPDGDGIDSIFVAWDC